MKRAAFVLLTLCFAARLNAQAPPNLNNVDVHILPVQGNIYMLVGAGANITVQVGSDGVLIVGEERMKVNTEGSLRDLHELAEEPKDRVSPAVVARQLIPPAVVPQ